MGWTMGWIISVFIGEIEERSIGSWICLNHWMTGSNGWLPWKCLTWKVLKNRWGFSMHDKEEKKLVTLVIGGGRSGKSTWAEAYARSHEGKRIYLATAEAFDDEMKKRIKAHQARRSGEFITIEEPLELSERIMSMASGVDVCLIDCLTVWLGNLMHYEKNLETYLEDLYRVVESPPCELILVTNETGLGIIPTDSMSRTFRDRAGWMNQRLAVLADRVVLLVAGIPLALKGTLS